MTDSELLKTLDILSHSGFDNFTISEMAQYMRDEDPRLPCTYAEIDYGDREDAEAIEGAKWDDMNYLHYIER